MFRKESLTYKRNFKRSVFKDFSVLVQSYCLVLYFKKNEETLNTRNHKKTKELSFLRPEPRFLYIKKVCVVLKEEICWQNLGLRDVAVQPLLEGPFVHLFA